MDSIRKTSRFLLSVLRVVYALVLIFCGIALAALAAVYFFAPDSIAQKGTYSLTLGFAEVTLTQGAPAAVARGSQLILLLMPSVALCAGFACYTLRLLMRILRPMTQGLPFDGSVSRLLRRLAYAELIFGALFAVMQLVIQRHYYTALNVPSLFSSEAVSSVRLSSVCDGSFLIVFAVLLLLSYIFRYAQELQTLSDETL